MCKWHLSQLSVDDAWTKEADFHTAQHPFVEVPLTVGKAVELTFKENLVRITSQPRAATASAAAATAATAAATTAVVGRPASPSKPGAASYVKNYAAAGEAATPPPPSLLGGLSSQNSTEGSDTHSQPAHSQLDGALGADGSMSGATHAQADYSEDAQWIELWFKNECRLVSGLTLWGSYTYGRWWKGLAARYVRTATVDGSEAPSDVDSAEVLYSYAELEHEAAGPTLAVGLWRLKPLPPELLAQRDKMRVQICLAKAKAFGIKRTVHRVSLAYSDLINRRTTITWVQD